MSEEYKRKQRIFWEKFWKTPESEAYSRFKKKTDPLYNKPRQSLREVLGKLDEIPLIGVEKTENPFGYPHCYNKEEYYDNPFFLFEQDTPSMRRISTKEAINQNMSLVGVLHGIIWGTVRIPGHSSDDYHYYGAQELFIRLAKYFKNNNTRIPNFFDLEISDSKEYSNRSNINKYVMGFGARSPVCCLTLFGERKLPKKIKG